jgi:DNA-binding transcriptional ArsR family regulator
MTKLDSTFAALADPTRRAILERLRQGDATLNELAAPFDMTLQAVSRHLQVLEHAGLVTRSRSAQRRPAHLSTRPLEEAADWLSRCGRPPAPAATAPAPPAPPAPRRDKPKKKAKKP